MWVVGRVVPAGATWGFATAVVAPRAIIGHWLELCKPGVTLPVPQRLRGLLGLGSGLLTAFRFVGHLVASSTTMRAILTKGHWIPTARSTTSAADTQGFISEPHSRNSGVCGGLNLRRRNGVLWGVGLVFEVEVGAPVDPGLGVFPEAPDPRGLPSQHY